MNEDRKLEERKSVIDQQIRDAMSSGKFDNLPGTGKPLKLDDDATPRELQMAHKLLKDNELAPAWIMDGKDLERILSDMRKALRKAAQDYRRGGVQAEAFWTYARRSFTEAAVAYNRKVLSYNLKTPPGVAHRLALDIQKEIDTALQA